MVVGYTDTIGSGTTSIKNWIEGLYNAGTAEDPAPSFVLFVGDAQQIPAWSGSAGSHITDLRYCEFTGDNFPEIYYGRFSAQNTTQLQPQIDKTLEYEQYTMPDPSYLGEVTLVSGVDSSYADPYGNGQINYGTNNYFNAAHGISPHVWLYPDSDGSGVPAAVRQTVSDGVGFYNYTAHCGHTGPSDPSFTTSDIDNLINAHKYLLGIGNCCLSNTFGTNYSTPCFGEKWLQAENKGGIGWIGGSNSTYWDEDYWWGVGNGPIDGDGPSYSETGIGAYDGVFHDHGEPVTRHYTSNGGIIFAGNMAVTEAGSSRTQYYWEIYHLMGDPSVMTYMGVPSNNNISHPSSITTSDTSVTVQADLGSYAGLSRDGVLHGAGYIDTSGSATISITPFGSEGSADIVVTCQNRVPYTSTISVTGGTTPPIAPVLTWPTNYRFTGGLTPIFKWKSVVSNPPVVNYRLQIRDLNTVIKFDQEVGNVTKKKIPSSGLQYNETYKWRVKAENNLGWGSWSSYEYFKTPQTPYAPTIIYPKGGTTTPTTVTVQWQAVSVTPAVDTYHVQVYRASDNKLLRDRQITNTSTTVTLPGQTTYKWHVRAHNSKAWGPWCDYKRFNTN